MQETIPRSQHDEYEIVPKSNKEIDFLESFDLEETDQTLAQKAIGQLTDIDCYLTSLPNIKRVNSEKPRRKFLPRKCSFQNSEPTHELRAQYGEVLFDHSKAFHGIGFDFLRLKSILEKGILSEQEARQQKVSLVRNSPRGYNLSDNVSVAESPAINSTFTFGAFANYIRNGISFVISGGERLHRFRGGPRDSDIPGEAFVKEKVKKENIVGIMIPEDKLDSSLFELPFRLVGRATGSVDDRCIRTINDLESETGYRADTLQLEKLMKQKEELEQSDIDYLKKDKPRKAILAQMEREMTYIVGSAFAKKLGKENPVLRDILKLYIPESMRVYNSDGFEISL